MGKHRKKLLGIPVSSTNMENLNIYLNSHMPCHSLFQTQLLDKYDTEMYLFPKGTERQQALYFILWVDSSDKIISDE